MFKTLAAAGAAAALLGIAGTPSAADAATTWPAKCSTMSCVNAHLNALRTSQLALKNRLACFTSYPVTSYGDYSNGTFGYRYEDMDTGDAFLTTALDWTLSGDYVDAWIVVNDCKTQLTARAMTASTATQAFHREHATRR